MKWTCKQIENVMNYLRIVNDATVVFMFDIDRDRIGYFTSDGAGHTRDFSHLYNKMLDSQN